MKPHDKPHRMDTVPVIHDAMHYRHAFMLVALLLLILGYPFVAHLPYGNFVFSLATSLVLFTGVVASINDGRTFRRLLAIGIPALLLNWVQPFYPSQAIVWLSGVFTILFFAFTIATLINSIFRQQEVSTDDLYAAVCAYLLIGIAFGFIFNLVALASPGSFRINGVSDAQNPLDIATSIYFSFAALTTAGYGDITPITAFARGLAIIESITGVFYVAIMISRLVSSYATQEMRRR